MSNKIPFYSVKASRLLQIKTALGTEITALKERFTTLDVQYKKERARVIAEKKQEVIDKKNEEIELKALILLEPYDKETIRDIINYVMQPYFNKYYTSGDILTYLKVNTYFYLLVTKLGEKTLKKLYTTVRGNKETPYTLTNKVLNAAITGAVRKEARKIENEQ